MHQKKHTLDSHNGVAGTRRSFGKCAAEMPLTRPNVQFEIVTDVEDFAALQQEWSELWRRVGGSPFQSFRCCFHALHEAAIPKGESLYCIVGRRTGRMVLAWPLIRYREYIWTTLRPLVPDAPEQTDVLVENGDDTQSLVSAAWHTLLSSCASDIVSLPCVRTESILHRCALGARWLAHAHPHTVVQARLQRYSDWIQYRRTLPEAFRKEQDYHRRRLVKAGKVAAFVSRLDEAASATYVNAMFAWKQQWAARTAAKGNFFEKTYQNFLLKILTDPCCIDFFRLFVLSLNGAAIAINLVAITDHAVIGMQAAYDPAYAKCSPGSLLLEHIMQWAFDNKRDVDFGSGDARYKALWTGGQGYACTDFRIAVTRWGRLAFAVSALRRKYESFRHRIGAGALSGAKISGPDKKAGRSLWNGVRSSQASVIEKDD